MFNRNIITAFTKINLSESGMRGTQEFEIINNGETSGVSLYQIIYSGGKDERRLIESAECDTDSFIQLMNSCRIYNWNGFSGRHPRGVRDGIMFKFTAVVNGDTKISASGSENFPKHYREFTKSLYEMLHG